MLPTQSYNNDCVKIHNDINRFIHEIQESNSANLSGVISYDSERIKSYLSALKTFHDFAQSMPILDQPETSPTLKELRPAPAIKVLENESLNYLVQLMVDCRDELMNSVSARSSTKMNEFDSKRFLAFLDKMELYMADYVEVITPLDLPDSSPRAAMTTDGKKGI